MCSLPKCLNNTYLQKMAFRQEKNTDQKKKERKWMQKGMVSKSLDGGQLYIFLRLETGTISLRMLKAVIM